MVRYFVLLIALLHCSTAVKDTETGPPLPKKPPHQCYFAHPKKGHGETEDRPRNSQTTDTCKGELTELSALANSKLEPLHGAPHELALILARFEGRFLNRTDSVIEWNGAFICAHHLRELSRQWSQFQHKHISWKGGKPACGHYDHGRNLVQSKAQFSLSYDQSARVLKEKGILMQAGLPLCQRHNDALNIKPEQPLVAVKDEPMTEDFDDVCYADDKAQVKEELDKSFTHTERMDRLESPLEHHFKKYAEEAGATRFRCRKSFHELSYHGQYSKVRVALLLENTTIAQLAGDSIEDQEKLSALIRRVRDGKPTSNEDHEILTAVLDDVAKEYRLARNTQERVMIISLFARRIPYRVLSKYIDGLSERLFNQAKKKAIDAKSYKEPDHSRQRYDPVKLSHFISFITSSHVLIGLPYGESRTRDSKGNPVSLPNYIRTMGIYETINLYEKYMRESGRESLIYSNSTTYRILKTLPSMQTTSLTCVDYFQASSTMAFIAIERMLDEMDTLALIDSTDVKFLKNSFEDMKVYLKGNFRLHLKSQSIYSDHCLSWSLSDPKDPRLSAHPSDHVHSTRCEECKKIDQTISYVSPTKIDRISELGTFSFNGDVMRGWRFHGLGQGIEFKNLVPINASFVITQNGGKTASEAVRISDEAKIALGQEPSFWYVPPERTYAQMHEVNDVDDDVASEVVHQNPATAHEESVFYCPVCGASFIKYSNLVRHIDTGKHRIRPDRVSLLDYALDLFKGYLEDIKQAVKLTPLSDSIRALVSGSDEELPKGWALRMTRKGGRYPEKSKKFVMEKFTEAQNQRRKLKAEEVELLLKAEDSIEPHERMSLDQIRNFIRTLAEALKKPKKTRGSRSAPIYTDDDGYIEEEVDVPEEDHRYTDDDLYMHVTNHLEYYFTGTNNPELSDGDVGDDFE